MLKNILHCLEKLSEIFSSQSKMADNNAKSDRSVKPFPVRLYKAPQPVPSVPRDILNTRPDRLSPEEQFPLALQPVPWDILNTHPDRLSPEERFPLALQSVPWDILNTCPDRLSLEEQFPLFDARQGWQGILAQGKTAPGQVVYGAVDTACNFRMASESKIYAMTWTAPGQGVYGATPCPQKTPNRYDKR